VQGRVGQCRAGQGSRCLSSLSPVETFVYITEFVSLNPVGMPVGRDVGWA
jgi:hypothetical protein